MRLSDPLVKLSVSESSAIGHKRRMFRWVAVERTVSTCVAVNDAALQVAGLKCELHGLSTLVQSVSLSLQE